MEIRLIVDDVLLRDAWRLRHSLRVDDAPFVSLALRYDVRLVTLDVRLARAAERLGARVLVP